MQGLGQDTLVDSFSAHFSRHKGELPVSIMNLALFLTCLLWTHQSFASSFLRRRETALHEVVIHRGDTEINGGQASPASAGLQRSKTRQCLGALPGLAASAVVFITYKSLLDVFLWVTDKFSPHQLIVADAFLVQSLHSGYLYLLPLLFISVLIDICSSYPGARVIGASKALVNGGLTLGSILIPIHATVGTLATIHNVNLGSWLLLSALSLILFLYHRFTGDW